ETQPANYLDGKDTIGSQGGIAGNDVFSSIVLADGVAGVNNNFGELVPSTLSGIVFKDTGAGAHTNNGIKDNDEGAIFVGSGVVFHPDGTDALGNAVHLVTTANTNGFYQFVNLRPGTYAIHEEQPLGFVDGKETAGDLGGTVASTLIGGHPHTEADLIYDI